MTGEGPGGSMKNRFQPCGLCSCRIVFADSRNRLKGYSAIKTLFFTNRMLKRMHKPEFRNKAAAAGTRKNGGSFSFGT